MIDKELPLSFFIATYFLGKFNIFDYLDPALVMAIEYWRGVQAGKIK